MSKYGSERNWKATRLSSLHEEALRLVARIEKAQIDLPDNEIDCSYGPFSRSWAAVKRASLDLNMVAVKLRKGYYKDTE